MDSQDDFDTSAGKSKLSRVTHGVPELMKNVSESTSYTWKVFEIDKSFLKPDEIKSIQVSFECNSQRQEVTG